MRRACKTVGDGREGDCGGGGDDLIGVDQVTDHVTLIKEDNIYDVEQSAKHILYAKKIT